MANDLKARVKKWLDKQGQTQEWLAAKLGITGGHLSLILSGQRTPSLPVAARLEKVTGIPARDFEQVAS